MLPVLDSNQVSGGRVDKQFDFLLCIGDGVDGVIGTLDHQSDHQQNQKEEGITYVQPHDGTLDIEQSSQKPISFS